MRHWVQSHRCEDPHERIIPDSDRIRNVDVLVEHDSVNNREGHFVESRRRYVAVAPDDLEMRRAEEGSARGQANLLAYDAHPLKEKHTSE
jgi:hypothetical protein